jgi:hypothetical protein
MTTPWTPPGEELPEPTPAPCTPPPEVGDCLDELEQRSAEACDPAFKAFVGKALGRSELAYWVYYPTKRAWDALADHRITCVVGFPGKKTSGTLQDSRR